MDPGICLHVKHSRVSVDAQLVTATRAKDGRMERVSKESPGKTTTTNSYRQMIPKCQMFHSVTEKNHLNCSEIKESDLKRLIYL